MPHIVIYTAFYKMILWCLVVKQQQNYLYDFIQGTEQRDTSDGFFMIC